MVSSFAGVGLDDAHDELSPRLGGLTQRCGGEAVGILYRAEGGRVRHADGVGSNQLALAAGATYAKSSRSCSVVSSGRARPVPPTGRLAQWRPQRRRPGRAELVDVTLDVHRGADGQGGAAVEGAAPHGRDRTLRPSATNSTSRDLPVPRPHAPRGARRAGGAGGTKAKTPLWEQSRCDEPPAQGDDGRARTRIEVRLG